MLEDIGNLLQTNSLGTVGQDLFLGMMPDDPDNCVALFEYAGSPPDLHWQGEYPGLQVRVRNTSYEAGRSMAESIYRLLHGIYETFIGSTRYLLIKAQGSPEVLKRDQNNRIEWFINFSIMKERD